VMPSGPRTPRHSLPCAQSAQGVAEEAAVGVRCWGTGCSGFVEIRVIRGLPRIKQDDWGAGAPSERLRGAMGIGWWKAQANQEARAMGNVAVLTGLGQVLFLVVLLLMVPGR